MTTIIYDFFRRKRLEKNLNCHQLAKLIGYKNLNKGARRIQELENGKITLSKTYLQKLTKILKISKEEYNQILKKHKKAEAVEISASIKSFNKKKSRKIENIFYWRAMPTLFCKQKLPENARFNDQNALNFAANFLRQKNNKIGWVYLGFRFIAFFNKDGEMSIKKRTFKDPELHFQAKIKNSNILLWIE